MKKIVFLFFLIPFFIGAQVIQEGTSPLIYSLPQTELVIHVTSELVSETPGRFYQYSERFLATLNVITTEKEYYRIKSIQFESRAIPDPERTFTILPSKKSVANSITVNESGLLCGINVTSTREASIQQASQLIEHEYSQINMIMPLSEDILQAGSMIKMAEGAARQIYRLRENKEDILSGDVDYIPTDAVSLRAMLEEIEKEENELTKLFVGTTSTKAVTQTLVFKPNAALNNKVLFRYSNLAGVVSHDDLSGDPYYISIQYDPVEIVSNAKSPKVVKDVVYAIVPVSANITITNNSHKTLYEQHMSLPQLGVLIPIPTDTMDKYSKAYVSPENGRLLSVEQIRK